MIHPSSDRVRKLIRHPPDAGLADTENCNSPSIRPRLPKPALAWGFIPSFEIDLKWEATGVGLGERRLIFTGIAGHAPISVGCGYGLPTLSDMAAALKKFPRYEVE